jgi:phage terminase small subunit
MIPKKPPKKKELTPQQEQFCQEYLKDLNAKQAAIRAGYSEKTAPEQASRLLTNVNVQNRIQLGMNKRTKRTEIEADRIIRELARIGFSDTREIFNDDGNVKPVSQWPAHIARCIQSVEVLEEYQGSGVDRQFIGYTKKIKLWDKVKALELLGKHKVLFADKRIHDVTGTLEDLLTGSWKKEEEAK